MTQDPSGPSPPELLARYGSLIAEGIERQLPAGEPADWLYRPLAEYPRRAGKGLRAALCLAACEAFGGTAADALPAAIAIELLHNACLVHDDIQDGAFLRRGGPALHHLEGLPLALNAGDALALLGMEVLRSGVSRLGRRLADRVTAEFANATWRTLEGQAMELGWRRDGVTEVSVDDYLRLVLHKTCWYTAITPLRIGALIGSAGHARLVPLSRLGFCLGVAFQVTDDVLNVSDGLGDYDKDADADLREGKRTLILVHLLAAASPADREQLVGRLKSGAELSPDDVRWLRELLHRYGSVDVGRAFARGAADAAADALPAAFRTALSPAHVAVVGQLLNDVVNRTH